MVGVNALWITVIAGKVNSSVLIYLPVAIVASILPDIDAARAKIHYVAGGALSSFQGIFRGKYFYHRGIMHSIFATIIFGGILTIFFQGTELYLLPAVFMTAYFSHLLIDGFNTSVAYLSPIYLKRFALMPKSMQTPVGGLIDNALFFVAAFGLIFFSLVFRYKFIL